MDTQKPRDYGFMIGLLTGTFVGAGLAVWLAPKAAAELRGRIADAAGELARKGNGIRDEVADKVARGAHEVERLAVAARSDRR